jgi:hypothetical protein
MTKDFDQLWTEGPDPLAEVTAPAKPSQTRKPREQNYLHEDMEEVVAGANATSIVWLRLLQLRRMRKEKHIILSNDWLAQHGVSRHAKTRALQMLERRGLIRVAQSTGSSPRVVIIPRRDRRRTTKSSAAEPRRCAA